MKTVFSVMGNIIFCSCFLFGLPICMLSWREFASLDRVAGILTSRLDSWSPMEGCQGAVTISSLMKVRYRIYIMFEDGRFDHQDRAYFDRVIGEPNRGYFWESRGSALNLTLVDADGGVVVPRVVGDYESSHFVFGPTDTGQSIGVLDNSRWRIDRLTMRYSIETNCERILSLQPKIRLCAIDKKQLELTRMGIVSLAISSPWIAFKWLRRKKTHNKKFA